MTTDEQLMKTAVEAWGHSDNGPITAALDDDEVWISAASQWDERLRSGGIHKGRAQVIALLSKIATAFFPTACVAKDIRSAGDVVWGIFQVTSGYAANGSAALKSLTWEFALRWRIKNGKVVDSQTFFDTADMLRQQGHPC